MNAFNIKRAFIRITEDTEVFALIAVFGSALVILLENVQSIIRYFDESSGLTSDTSSELIGNAAQKVFDKLNALPHGDSIGIAVLFALAAVAIYAGYIVISNALITARNEVVLEQGVRDNSLREYLIVRALIKVGVAFALTMFLLVSLQNLFPHWIHRAGNYIRADFNSAFLTDFGVGYVCLVLNVYLLLAFSLFGLRYIRNT